MAETRPERPDFTPERAAELAAIGYDETERDKFGKGPYSNHPRRLEEVFNTPEMVDRFGQEDVTTIRSIALLHDIYKREHGNGKVTEKTLVDEGASLDVLDGVDAMSKRDGQEPPDEHIARIKKNFFASIVDIADIADNREGKSWGQPRPKKKQIKTKYKERLGLLIEGDERLIAVAPIINKGVRAIYREKKREKAKQKVRKLVLIP